MDTQTQIDRLIELAIIQRSELKQLVEQLPQLREHLNAEVEKVFDETEPQLRAELEEWTTKQTADKTAALGVALEAKIAELSKNLEISTQARYNAIIAEREENARLAAQAEAKIAEHAASLPGAVKEIVSAELARFPRAGEIDQLRKEFAEPRGLNPRGKWQAGETYNKLDLVTINGDSYTSNTDGNRTRPSRSSADWTLVAARGTGGGGGPTSLSELTTVPSDGDVLIGSGTSWVTSNLTAGAGISITVGPGAITISATDGDITLDDGTAASPSLHFTNDADTGIYRPAANTLGISTSGVQRMYVDENGITTVGAGGTFDGSVHAANGNANNPSFSFSGDQDTGFFRHQPNEIGVSLGGTQYATLTSTTFSITPVVTMASSLRVNGTTDSTNKDTGAIVTEGGLGVEKSATIGGNLTVNGTGGISSPVANGVLNLGDNSSGPNLRLVGSAAGSNAYIQVGTSSSDATGSLNISRYQTGTSTIGYFNVYAGSSTFSGNLTVSGTGTSSVAGNWFVGTTTAAASGARLQAQLTGTDGTVSTLLSLRKNTNAVGTGVAIDFIPESTDVPLAKLSAVRTNVNNGYTDFRFSTWNGSALVEQLRLVGQTGNLLINTTSDGGQKLQVAGTVAKTAAGPTTIAIASNEAFNLRDEGRLFIVGNASAGSRYLGLEYYDVGNGAYRNVAAVPNGGNFLVGTTVDSSALLQVGTNTTTAAGGMKFGTDTSLYRSAAGALQLESSATAVLEIDGGAGNTRGVVIQAAGTEQAAITVAASGTSLLLSTGSPRTTALTLDSSQNATFAGKITANGAGSTFKGTATNDNAAAGYVGEFVSSAVVSASAVSLTNGTAANITSISLTAGDWDVTGLVQYNFTGATCSYVFHGFSTASASFGAPNSYVQDYRNYTTASVSTHNPSLTFRISLAATTTIYFVTQADFSAGTVAAYGRIQARRIR